MDELDLKWDKEQQKYSQNAGFNKMDENEPKDVQKYFDFLEDVLPNSPMVEKIRVVPKQFKL